MSALEGYGQMVNSTHRVNQCGCNLAVIVFVEGGDTEGILEDGVIGAYLHLRHYNYNDHPVYYKSENGKKDLYLYYGPLNNEPGAEEGWLIHSQFGLTSDSIKLFHATTNSGVCPENVGLHWHTMHQRDIQDVKVKCL